MTVDNQVDTEKNRYPDSGPYMLITKAKTDRVSFLFVGTENLRKNFQYHWGRKH